jgi:aspartate kinase
VHTNTWPTWRLRENLIVQKYGGSSIASVSGIQGVARRIVDTQNAGYSVVAVLPAMGDTTNDLLALAAEVAPLRASRELDVLLSVGEQISVSLLAIAISSLGPTPQVLTGGEAGLITDGIHGNAHIVGVYPERVRVALARREIPLVAGSQGTSRETNEVTTLGPGGPDRTAVALAAALDAGVCEIYSEVEGGYTADPRIAPAARKVDMIPSVQTELAAGEDQVLPLRHVEYAHRSGGPIQEHSAFDPPGGTWVESGLKDDAAAEDSATLEDPIFGGITLDRSQVQITVAGVPNSPGTAAQIFRVTEAAGVCPDMITQSSAFMGDHADISFLLPGLRWPAIVVALSAAQGSIGFRTLQCEDVGMLSLTGYGMREGPNVYCRVLGALSEAGIRIRLYSDSGVHISVVTDPGMLDHGVQALGTAFRLSREMELG